MRRDGERGAALLIALLVVAFLSSLAVGLLEGMRRGVRMEANADSLAQAQWYAIGAEEYAKSLLSRTVGRPEDRLMFSEGPIEAAFPIETGLITVEADDASRCFNLNAVVEGAGDVFQRAPGGVARLSGLLRLVGASPGAAQEIAASTAAWMDTDGVLAGAGSDDAPYQRGSAPYLSGEEPFAEASEWRAVRGVTPEVYAAARPFVCALPFAGASPLNINSLREGDEVLLASLTNGETGLDAARRAIAARPEGGWPSAGAFWTQPALAGTPPSDAALEATALDTRYVALTIGVTHLDAEVTLHTLLFHTGVGYVATARKWTPDE